MDKPLNPTQFLKLKFSLDFSLQVLVSMIIAANHAFQPVVKDKYIYF